MDRNTNALPVFRHPKGKVSMMFILNQFNYYQDIMGMFTMFYRASLLTILKLFSGCLKILSAISRFRAK